MSQSGVDYVFLPNQGHIYPSGFSTYVNNNLEGNVFEGEFRKNHFQGVLTVVAKLMNIIKPNKIYFGEKDAQQLFLVRKMISDLNFDIELRSIRTIREPNGLASSSRNFYLSDKEIEEAGSIYKSLCSSSKLWKNGERNLKVIKNEFIKGVKGIDNIKIQYVETVDPGTFSPIDDGEEAILIVAAVLGNTRLIDNIILFKKDKIGIKGFVSWIVFSICVGAISIFPGAIDFLLKVVSINIETRGLAILAVAVFLIFIIIYKQAISQQQIRNAVDKLVQEMAILNYKFDKNITPKNINI